MLLTVRTVGLPAGKGKALPGGPRHTGTQGHRDTGTDAADNYSEASGAAEASGAWSGTRELPGCAAHGANDQQVLCYQRTGRRVATYGGRQGAERARAPGPTPH